jgi:hypothetical protein
LTDRLRPAHRIQTWLVAILQSGVNEGSIDSSVSPDASSRILIATVLGLLLQAFFDPNGPAWGM